MRILIAYKVAKDILQDILDDNIIYRPDLQIKGSHFIGKTLTEVKPDVLIVQELPEEQAIRSWESAMPTTERFIVQKVNSLQAGDARQFWFAGVRVFASVPNEPKINESISKRSNP